MLVKCPLKVRFLKKNESILPDTSSTCRLFMSKLDNLMWWFLKYFHEFYEIYSPSRDAALFPSNLNSPSPCIWVYSVIDF